MHLKERDRPLLYVHSMTADMHLQTGVWLETAEKPMKCHRFFSSFGMSCLEEYLSEEIFVERIFIREMVRKCN